MRQSFGCAIINKKSNSLFRKDSAVKVLADLGFDIKETNKSCSLDDYMVSDELDNSEIGLIQINDYFLLLGFPLYTLLNIDNPGKVVSEKRTIHQFTQHWKGEYGYKYYQDGVLCTHRVCFGDQNQIYNRSWAQGDQQLPQSGHPVVALQSLADDLEADIGDLETLHMSMPRNGKSALAFHPDKQSWVYGRVLVGKNVVDGNTFQEMAPAGHKRGKPFIEVVHPKSGESKIMWAQVFYEWNHRTIQSLLGFRSDRPSTYPDKTTLRIVELNHQKDRE